MPIGGTTMPDDVKSPGQQLEDLLEDLNALIPMATDAELARIEVQRAAVLEESARLIGANLKVASLEYRKATARLQAASATIKCAILGMENVAKAIEAVGQALELAAKLKP